ncbi:helix-hairpin-helix domain-containing protein [Hathewaya histolytica]|uniref:DNA-binding competence protein n=1 Tax=Hathewaya histolytica TaxID=1498 RepID=A0A4U9RFU9_HATHI|nr:helix-hairpin-helix domain-containing protein [Hathewaya histolytica]VTQ90772.1 DNA-binding competence protein [Hathewaya histolytica]
MKNKEKIFGSIGILLICVILFIGGYFINNNKNNQYKDIFDDYDMEKTETVYKSKNPKDIKQNKNNKDNHKDGSEEVSNHKGEEVKGDEDSTIKVDIKGAVKKPGIYTLSAESRISDIVNMAGGFLQEAELIKVNLSKRLQDEDLIYIPKKGENIDPSIEAALTQGIDNKANKENSHKANAKDKSEKININKASVEELKTLPGIGETRANSIIQYREEKGGFKSADELKNISGIGDKTLDKFIHKVDIK